MNKKSVAVLVACTIALLPTSAHATWPGRNGRIAYVHQPYDPDPQPAHIWTTTLDRHKKQLTDGDVFDYNPQYSPNGRRIAFTRCDSAITQQSHSCRLWVMRSDGSKAHAVSKPGWFDDPAWAPSGKLLAFKRCDRRFCHISTLEVATGAMKDLTNRAIDTSPEWKPNGHRIAFARAEGGIFTIGRSGGNPSQLTTGNRDFFPSWAADGQGFLFASSGIIKFFDVASEAVTTITSSGENWGRAAFSPRRDVIVAERLWEDEIQLYTMNPDGSAQRRLTRFRSLLDDKQPDWGAHTT